MKKIAIVLMLTGILLSGSLAEAKKIASYKPLNDSAGTAISAYSLTSGVAVYSETLDMTGNVGFCTLLITENQAGGTGDVDISVEYSIDGSNWYAAYTSNMSGTITAEGNIVTTLQNNTRWIVFTPRLTRSMRYKFDPDANSKITVWHLIQEES